jgi:hypothetical protein
MDIKQASEVIQVIPTIDTTAQVSGDVLCQVTKIPGAVRAPGGGATLQAITMVDRDKKGYDLEVHFFKNAAPAGWAANGAAADLSDAGALHWLGKVAITDADDPYVVFASNYLWHKSNLALPLQAEDGALDIYFGIISREANHDYTAATDLVLNFHLLQD